MCVSENAIYSWHLFYPGPAKTLNVLLYYNDTQIGIFYLASVRIIVNVEY